MLSFLQRWIFRNHSCNFPRRPINNPNHFFPQVSGSRFRSAARRALLTTGVALVLFLFSAEKAPAASSQIIGSFPEMSGGFEDDTAGTIPTVNAIASGSNTTTWAATGGTKTITASGGRSGPHYATYGITGTTTYNLFSPTATDSAIANSTAYTVQFYYRTSGSTAPIGYRISISPDGSGQPGTYVDASLSGTSGVWTKFTGSVTSGNSSASPRYGIGIIRATNNTVVIDIDDYVIYDGAVDNSAPDPPTGARVSGPSTNSLTISWTAPGTGVDGGGYLVVRGTSDPTTAPNVNGIYAVGNTADSGQTVVYIGTSTSCTDTGLTASTTYYYRVYTVDKAFNYSTAATANGSTTTYGEVAQYPLGQSPSGGWPADNAWQALSALNDANNGANQRFDFVGDTSNPCGYWAQNSSYVFFRMRVQTNSVSATTHNGLGTLWVYIDTNSDNIADCSFAWDKKSNDDANHGLEGQKLKNSGGTWNTLEMKDLDNNEGTKGVEDINGNGRTGEGYVRSIDGQTTDNFGTTTFIDFAVSWAYLRTYSTTGLNTGQTWRIAFGSGDEKLDFEPPNLDVAGGANPSSSTSVGWSGSFAPTAVVLLQLQAVTVNGQVTVRWSTSSETDTAGFDLYRLVDGQWVKLNATLIPAQGWPNGGIGASYSVADPTAKPGQTYTYKLVERTTDGQSIEYGPYERTVTEFAVKNFEMTPQGFKLKWLSRAGEKYRVLKCSDLRSGQYAPIAENLAATPPENEYVDPVATGAAFYRIELQP